MYINLWHSNTTNALGLLTLSIPHSFTFNVSAIVYVIFFVKTNNSKEFWSYPMLVWKGLQAKTLLKNEFTILSEEIGF